MLVRGGGVELYNYSPLIYAHDCTNIAITGPGKLNGNGSAWWDWKLAVETKVFFDTETQRACPWNNVFSWHTVKPPIRPELFVLVELHERIA